MPSPQMESFRIREALNDAENIKAQRAECSWSHRSAWGKSAASRFVMYGHYLKDRLYHDDVVADFGGNDGFAAYEFYRVHKIKPIVVECDPEKIEFARTVFKLSTCESYIEKMPLLDKSVDWGFCSHTLEHTRDTVAALNEIRRVVKRGCFFIVPLESKRHAKANHAHYIQIARPEGWRRLLEENGWNIIIGKGYDRQEYHAIAEPK